LSVIVLPLLRFLNKIACHHGKANSTPSLPYHTQSAHLLDNVVVAKHLLAGNSCALAGVIRDLTEAGLVTEIFSRYGKRMP
jgi:hypothetical protein